MARGAYTNKKCSDPINSLNYDALNLVQFYNVPPETVSVCLFPFAFGNLLGPILLGHLFDSIGRKTMITLTYAVWGVLLAVTGYLFQIGVLNALTQTIAWSIIFFIASAAASSAYLTVSEIFPLEIRGLAKPVSGVV
jgi:MFS family permease